MQRVTKAIRALPLVGLLVFSNLVFILSSNVSAMEGDGSEETPYRIETCQDLQDIDNDLDAYYVLANDINCSVTSGWNGGAGFSPIGSFDNPFLGELDGDYHTISNLFIDTTLGDNNPGGLFDRIGQSDNQIGLVKDTALEDIDVTGGWSTGGLVGVLYGQVDNTYTTGEVNGSGEVGGLVGSHGGIWDTVIDSWSSATVTGTSDVIGGLVGYNAPNSNIINSYAVGSVSSGDDYVGGLVGVNEGNIENTYASGNVFAADNGAGGLVGRNVGTISYSFATGYVSATNYDVGGFVGNNRGEISLSYSDNSNDPESGVGVLGDCSVGGFVGKNNEDPDGTIHNSYSRSDVANATLACAVGGFAGTNEHNIYQTYSTGSVNGALTDIGGYAGNVTGSVQISFWDTQTSGVNNACGSFSTFDCDDVNRVIAGNSTNMKVQSTYTNEDFAEGMWDFNNVWSFEEGVNDDYPVLRNIGVTPVEWLEEQEPADLNGDNIDDSEQPNIGGYEYSETGKIIAIDVGEGCELNVDDTTRESQLSVQDPDYDYENGLWEFEADCGTPGATTTIKLYYYDVSIEGLSVRKYNPNTNQYFNIPGATLEQQTINGSSVAVATYQITDGGALDMDLEANGEIVDPAGIATSVGSTSNSSSLAETGSSLSLMLILSLALLVGSVPLSLSLVKRIN